MSNRDVELNSFGHLVQQCTTKLYSTTFDDVRSLYRGLPQRVHYSHFRRMEGHEIFKKCNKYKQSIFSNENYHFYWNSKILKWDAHAMFNIYSCMLFAQFAITPASNLRFRTREKKFFGSQVKCMSCSKVHQLRSPS